MQILEPYIKDIKFWRALSFVFLILFVISLVLYYRIEAKYKLTLDIVIPKLEAVQTIQSVLLISSDKINEHYLNMEKNNCFNKRKNNVLKEN